MDPFVQRIIKGQQPPGRGCTALVDPLAGPRLGQAVVLDVPAVVQRSVDLLFVIDNSQSMEAAQDSLLANFPRFIEVLSRGEQGLPSLHVGVISTDMGAVDQLGGCVEGELPICDNLVDPNASSVLPCYLSTPSPEQCTTTPTGLRLDAFYGSTPPEPGARLTARCLID